MQMLADLLLMSNLLIRRSRLSCATQAEIIFLDIRFTPMEHTHSLVPKSLQLWLWPRAFCGVTNMVSKSGTRIGRRQCRLNFGKRHATVITLPIPKSASARCIVGVSPSTPPSSTHGVATSACQRTLTILLSLQCHLSSVCLSTKADMRVC